MAATITTTTSRREAARDDLEQQLWTLLRAGLDAGRAPGNGSARMADYVLMLIELRGIELDAKERRQLRWLAGGEVHTLATIVTLITGPAPTVGAGPAAQQRAAQRIVDLHPQFTMGQALGIIAEALDALGVIGGDDGN